MLTKCGSDHPAACCCDRCKKGVETFLLESDIAEIQRDAREGMVAIESVRPTIMVPIEDVRPAITLLATLNFHYGERADLLAALRAKHPELFTT